MLFVLYINEIPTIVRHTVECLQVTLRSGVRLDWIRTLRDFKKASVVLTNGPKSGNWLFIVTSAR